MIAARIEAFLDSLLSATQVGGIAFAEVAFGLADIVRSCDEPTEDMFNVLADIADAIDDIPTQEDPVTAAGVLRRDILARFARAGEFGEPVDWSKTL